MDTSFEVSGQAIAQPKAEVLEPAKEVENNAS